MCEIQEIIGQIRDFLRRHGWPGRQKKDSGIVEVDDLVNSTIRAALDEDAILSLTNVGLLCCFARNTLRKYKREHSKQAQATVRYLRSKRGFKARPIGGLGSCRQESLSGKNEPIAGERDNSGGDKTLLTAAAWKFVDQLPTAERELIHFRYKDGVRMTKAGLRPATWKATAKRFDTSDSTLQGREERALERLREMNTDATAQSSSAA